MPEKINASPTPTSTGVTKIGSTTKNEQITKKINGNIMFT